MKKKYRPNVAAVILSPNPQEKSKFFVAQRSDMVDVWQFPQGGIDKGETPKEALYRELLEEIGCNDIDILGEYPTWISYDFPKKSRGKIYPFDGQTQKYFLVQLKKDSKIDLQAYDIPEFNKYEFVEYDELLKKVTYLRRSAYKRVIDYFIDEGFVVK